MRGMDRYRYVLLVLSIFLLGCSISHEELNRVTSPDGLVEAVMVRSNAGATTAYVYRVYIVKEGGKTSVGEEIFRADHLEGFRMEWEKPRFLALNYDQGRIFHFSNFWQAREVQNFKYVVEIRLRPSPKDFSLSKRDRWSED